MARTGAVSPVPRDDGAVPDPLPRWPDLVAAFVHAGDGAAALAHADEVGAAWTSPSALSGFTVGGLVSHLYAALRRLEVAMDDDLPEQPVPVPVAAFYGANRLADEAAPLAGIPAAIVEDAEHRAELGHQAVVRRLDEVRQRLGARLPADDPDRPVPVVQVPGGTTSLAGYVRTRIVELVVHTDDLATSVGRSAAPPADAAAVTIGVLLELGEARVGNLGVIRAMSRAERAGPDDLRVL
jgi:uncharacterized protein (TIGR03083 family)